MQNIQHYTAANTWSHFYIHTVSEEIMLLPLLLKLASYEPVWL